MFSWISCPFLELVFSVLVDVQFYLFAIKLSFITKKEKEKKRLFNFKLFVMDIIMTCLSLM